MKAAARGDRALLQLLAQWWRAPGEYRWLLGFLKLRGALGALPILTGAGGAVLAVIVVLVQFGLGGPEGIVGRVIDGMIAGVAVAVAVAWALEWWWAPRPSPRRSLVLVAGANAAITVSCV